MRRQKYTTLTILTALMLGLLFTPGHVIAGEDACATVKIEIVQELTFERQAFDAKMKINNGLADPLEDIRIDVYLTDESGGDVSSIFFVRIADMDNIQAIDGTGVVSANSAAEIHWLIIPSAGAGGQEPGGVVYSAGATLSYTAGGVTESMDVEPDEITVKPQPLLVLDYFLPRYVYGDDPYTDTTEPPIPYDLGVRVKNTGFGPAWNLKIDSGQPKIVENTQGLLIDFRIIGSKVNGQPSPDTLLVDFGNIESSESGMAAWQMISTLTGRFIEFNASFTHDDDLGGELTSLIDQVNAHTLIHSVRVDLPDRDDIDDFLGENSDGGVGVWESESYDSAVTDISGDATMSPNGGGSYLVTVPVTNTFVYVRIADPFQGRLPISSVYRSDGKHLPEDNVWVARERESGSQDRAYFSLFDTAATGFWQVTYNTDAVNDTTPPVSTLIPGDPHVGTDPLYVTSDTPLIFLAEDPESGVKQILFNIDLPEDGEYTGMVNPFMFSQRPNLSEGGHVIHFYAENGLDQIEAPNTANLVLDNSTPQNIALTATPAMFTPSAPADSGEDRQTVIFFSFDDAVPTANAVIDIAAGTGIFDNLTPVRSKGIVYVPGEEGVFAWDGTDDAGALQPPGNYSVRLSADDGLGHLTISSNIVITLAPWLDEASLSPSSGDQMYPDIRSSAVVWQDNRSGNWDVYLKVGQNPEMVIADGDGAQERPAVSESFIVWQDDTTGDFDIHYYNRTNLEYGALVLAGDQEAADVDGTWAVYQDNTSGNFEIYAVDLSQPAPDPVRISDGNDRDQVDPRISGARVTWADYRFGKPDIFLYDGLPSGILKRITVREQSYQNHPDIDGDIIAWVDTRNGRNDIFVYDITEDREYRLTFGTGDQVQPAISSGKIAYVDFTATDNPDIAWGSPENLVTGPVATGASRQEEPAVDGRELAWQDNSSGRWQIYRATVALPDLYIDIEPGLTFVSVPDELLTDMGVTTASGLMAALNGLGAGITRAERYDPAGHAWEEARWDTASGIFDASSTDFTVFAGEMLAVHANTGARLAINTLSSEAAITLSAGYNAVGRSGLPAGYTALDFIQGAGLESIRSIRSYDTRTGLFTTLSVEEKDDGAGNTVFVPRGKNFDLPPGRGFMVFMTRPVAGWRP